MESIPATLTKSLGRLGLSAYEAQVYAALVMFEHAEVKEIVEFLSISKPSVYEALDRLAEMGLALRSNSKPVRYSAVSPKMALDILMGNNQKASDDAFSQLKKLEKKKSGAKPSDVLWTIYGDTNIEYKIRDMFGNAAGRIECVMGERYLPYLEQVKIREARLDIAVISRDPACGDRLRVRFPQETVRIHVIDPDAIGLPLNHLPPEMKDVHEYLAFENMFALIADDEEILLIPPIADSSISALNTRNKGAIFFIRMLGQSHWGDIFAPEKPAGRIHSLIRGIHGNHAHH